VISAGIGFREHGRRQSGKLHAQDPAMRAHRVKARVSENHDLRVVLPSDFPPGEAEVIVLELSSDETSEQSRKLSVDELLAARLVPPPGVGPVTLSDIEHAIAAGATGRGSV
jgi:hypothetical protein